MKTFYFKQDSNYDKEYGNKDWLYINNFGYYLNISKDITTVRSVPRTDYHLLYVSSGEIYVNGLTLQNGDAYLFLPQEPHLYTYKKVENSCYYWIHFTGNKVSDILSHCEVLKAINRDNKRRYEKDAVLAMLTEELGRCYEEASDFAVSLLERANSKTLLYESHPGVRKHAQRQKRSLDCQIIWYHCITFYPLL